MKKGVRLLGLVCLAGILALVVAGCGLSTAQVQNLQSTVPQPNNLKIRGVVYGENADGTKGAPLAGAVLVLNGGTETVTSDANGAYVFTNVPQMGSPAPTTIIQGVLSVKSLKADGSTVSTGNGYTIVATKEGYQRTIKSNIVLGGGTNTLPDNSEINVDILMSSDPVVLQVTPAAGATIEAAAQTFLVVFDEAMDKTSVKPSLTSQGLRDYSVGDSQSLTCTWSADSKTLYASTGALLPNKFYQFQVDPNTTAKDTAGFLLDESPYDSGGLDSDIYNQYTEGTYLYYRTASNGAPGAPTSVLITVGNKSVIDFNDARTNVAVDLSWVAPASGTVTGYRTYVATSPNGPWNLLTYGNISSTTWTNFETNIAEVNIDLYGTYYGDYNAEGVKQMAFVTDTVYFKVVAYNGEGEGPGTVVSMRDSVKPTLAVYPGRGGYVDVYAYEVGVPLSLSASLPDYRPGGTAAATYEGCYVNFSEPMDPASVSDPTKYTEINGAHQIVQTAETASLVYEYQEAYVVKLTFGSALTLGNSISVESSATGPKDLSGNIMDKISNIGIIYDYSEGP